VTDAECASDHCILGTCRTAQAGIGASCDSDTDCSVNICRGLTCGCTSDSDCGGGTRCFNRVCRLLADSETCTTGAECQSGLCAYSGRQARNICYHPIPQPNGATCDLHQHCASGFCDYNQNYTCQSKLGNGVGGCGTDDTECQSGHCCAGTCGACCGDNDCPGSRCYSNTCRFGNTGEPCDAGDDCYAGVCSASTCGCNSDGECPGSRCYNRECRFGKNGEACDSNDDCASHHCTSFIFGTCVP